METPKGAVTVTLETAAHRDAGTVDWTMTFPDGAVGAAYARVTPDGAERSVLSFVLMAPPAPREALEGALEAQAKTLAKELRRLKEVLEAHDHS
jgi:hypothetical protein